MQQKKSSEKPKYYYIINADYIIPGHYWNNDVKVYTDEGDTYGSDGEEISKLYTWEELLSVLDDEYLLTNDVPDVAPTEITKEEDGHKIILSYSIDREQEYDDEDGHYEIRYYTYDIHICVKK